MTPTEGEIVSKIVVLRERRVLLDFQLAPLYGVSTGTLMQAVKRNARRFPADFMFHLSEQEVANLKSQTVISSSGSGWGGRRVGFHAFTEQGVAMLSSVLRSRRAIAVNIAIMRAFVRLREMARASKELASKLEELEQRVSRHDDAITDIVRAIRELALPPAQPSRRRIGF